MLICVDSKMRKANRTSWYAESGVLMRTKIRISNSRDDVTFCKTTKRNGQTATRRTLAVARNVAVYGELSVCNSQPLRLSTAESYKLKILGGKRTRRPARSDIFYLNGGSKVDFKRERALGAGEVLRLRGWQTCKIPKY